MTALPTDRAGVRPVPLPATPGLAARVLVAGLVGTAAFLTVAFAVRDRLPANVPSHFNASGAVDATTSFEEFVLIGVLVSSIVLVSLVLVAASIERSEALRYRLGPTMFRPLRAVLSFIPGVAVPVPLILVLLWSASLVPQSPWIVSAVPVLVATVPLLAILVWTVRRAGPISPGETPDPGLSALGGRSGPIFLCSACGQQFIASKWRLLGPRVGVSGLRGGAAYYFRCPRCGERGWQTRIGWTQPSKAPTHA